jgi:hypothetical protein
MLFARFNTVLRSRTSMRYSRRDTHGSYVKASAGVTSQRIYIGSGFKARPQSLGYSPSLGNSDGTI